MNIMNNIRTVVRNYLISVYNDYGFDPILTDTGNVEILLCDNHFRHKVSGNCLSYQTKNPLGEWITTSTQNLFEVYQDMVSKQLIKPVAVDIFTKPDTTTTSCIVCHEEYGELAEECLSFGVCEDCRESSTDLEELLDGVLQRNNSEDSPAFYSN